MDRTTPLKVVLAALADHKLSQAEAAAVLAAEAARPISARAVLLKWVQATAASAAAMVHPNDLAQSWQAPPHLTQKLPSSWCIRTLS
jgi:hypothetical protein